MSLAVSALRIAIVKALEGETSVGDRVFDSEIDPRQLLGENALPTIVVLAERGKKKVEGRDLIGSDHCVDLAIELFVARATKVKVKPGQPDEFVVEYPATDAAHENRLRRIAYEVETTLTGSVSPWAEVFKAFAVTLENARWDRGADGDGGRRFNFLRLVYSAETLGEPQRGAPLTPVWENVIGLMEADSELNMLGRDWRALITTPDYPAWRKVMSSLGLSYAELKGIGLAPLLDHQPNDLTDASQLGEATLDPDAIVIDAQ